MKNKSSIWILNGPNLNSLGFRQTNIYGNNSLVELEKKLVQEARDLGYHLNCLQSNHEGVLLDCIYDAYQQEVSALIINLGAWTHTNLSFYDALLAVKIPFIEVHISNIYAREEFRHKSVISPLALGVISGLGMDSYSFALQYLVASYNSKN